MYGNAIPVQAIVCVHHASISKYSNAILVQAIVCVHHVSIVFDNNFIFGVTSNKQRE
jgi:hypothetical protein